MKSIVLNFARVSGESLRQLNVDLIRMGFKISAVTSHAVERHKVFDVLGGVEHYSWVGYRSKAEWRERFNAELYKEVVSDKVSEILPLVERYSPFEGGSLEAETRVMQEFCRAESIIKKHNPAIVLFAKQPESALEYMLYLLSRHFNIPVLMTKGAGFRHSRVLCTRIDGGILTKSLEVDPSIVVPRVSTSGVMSKFTRAEIERIRSNSLSYVPSHVLDKRSGGGWLGAVFSMLQQISSPKAFFRYLIKRDSGPLFKRQLYLHYLRHVKPVPDVKGVCSVYFPLHYQPELTTMPLGGQYVNQIKAIKLISDALPADGVLLVKEHPSVFSYNTGGNVNFRSGSYYEWISRIPKVCLVHPAESSGLLQSSASFTACITGTAGLEAFINGRRVLVFGEAAYRNAPNVFHISDINLAEVLSAHFVQEEVPPKGDVVLDFFDRVESLCMQVDVVDGRVDLSDLRGLYFRMLAEGVEVLKRDSVI